MLKPLLITYEYPPDHGGIAKYLEQEVRHFEDAPDHTVKIMRAKEREWSKWPRWITLFWYAFSQLRKNQCDCIWVSHILPVGYVALIYKKLFKIPYRVYAHGLDLVRPRKSKWKLFWARRILNNADEIIVNSQATGQLLKNYRIDPSQACVQYPRIEKIDIEKYKPVAEKLRQKYNINHKPVLLTISRLVKRKGIDLVIRALPAVWRQIPDLVFVVVGDGDYRDRLVEARQCLVSTEKQNQIIFTGPVSDHEKFGWLAACDCFILTPIDDPNDFEGYGIVYKEAQMFNKPVIGSHVGGVPEAVGNEGVLVEPGNIEQITEAIIRIVDVISN